VIALAPSTAAQASGNCFELYHSALHAVSQPPLLPRLEIAGLVSFTPISAAILTNLIHSPIFEADNLMLTISLHSASDFTPFGSKL